jgi:hypothetical protein
MVLSLGVIFSPGAANSGLLFGQSHAGHVHAAGRGPVAPAGVVDGSVHPELISDQAALTVFWISLMEPPAAGAIERARFAAKTQALPLSEAEKSVLWSAAQDFYTRFIPYREQAQRLADAAAGKQATADSPAAVLQQRLGVAAAIDRLAAEAQQSVLAKLGARSAEALQAHLTEVKRHMKIVPPPAM